MALQGNYTTTDGINHPAAYLRVASIDKVSWDGTSATFTLAMYHDQPCRAAGKDEIYQDIKTITGADFTNTFSDTNLDTLGMNPRKAVYEWLKNNDYAGWTDV